MSRIFQSFGFKLFLALTLVVAFIIIVYSVVSIRHQERALLNRAILEADRFSDVIRRSTHYSMLLNRKQDVYQIISTIGDQPGVKEIRVFNKEGVIVFSTDSSEIGSRVGKEHPACIGCHSAPNAKATLGDPGKSIRILETATAGRVLSLSRPIFNERKCYEADCHAHESRQKVLGVLDVSVSMLPFDREIAIQKREAVIFTIILLIAIVIVVGLFVWRFVHVPIHRLITGTEVIASGNLSYQIPVKSSDEIGRLASAFNRMTKRLEKAYREIQEWSQSLEKKVEEKTEELRKAQEQMLFVQKMASLGKLAATVAHELNNPLAGILNYTKLIRRRLEKNAVDEDTVKDVIESLDIIASETRRCGNIVNNLLYFAKGGREGYETCNPNDIVRASLQLVQPQLEAQKIEWEFDADSNVPPIRCSGDQIKQAMLALFVNAIEAMPDGGRLTVSTSYDPYRRHVSIRIKDTGVGIDPENIPKIFEPFFTTKHETSGTGLGLSVVYGIVKRHGGDIKVYSRPGEGATFVLTFPLYPQVSEELRESF
jgi:two-component system NtrC family sensor kinase